MFLLPRNFGPFVATNPSNGQNLFLPIPMASWIQELNFPHLHIPIAIDHTVTVLPSAPIPVAHGDTLYLSNLDDMIGARVFTPTVYFYQPNPQYSSKKSVTEVLTDALARTLVPYYPFSGRLREAKNGKLELYFGPERGVLMVEAYSEMSLSQLGNLSVSNPAWATLIYTFSDEEFYKVIDMPLVIAQVTKFRCGGFSLGLRICHCMCDGIGAMQFLSAWFATARLGSLVTNPSPRWDREIFRPRDPPIVKYPHIEFMKIDDGSSLTASLWEVKPLMKCYRISKEFQAHLKTRAQPNDNLGCTTFDAMAAHVWRSWVKALEVKPLDYELRLTFSVNARSKLKNSTLNNGFYGNAVCVACVTSTVSSLVSGTLKETTKLVREARLGVSEDYLRSTIDYIEVDRPKRLEFGGKLTITQWTRFSMYECADFGWGRPVYAGPVDLTPTPQVCVLLPAAEAEGEADSHGAMVVCICLPESAANKFGEFLCLSGFE